MNKHKHELPPYKELVKNCNAIIMGLYSTFKDLYINKENAEVRKLPILSICGILEKNVGSYYSSKDLCLRAFLLERDYYEDAKERFQNGLPAMMIRWEEYYNLNKECSYYRFISETNEYEHIFKFSDVIAACNNDQGNPKINQGTTDIIQGQNSPTLPTMEASETTPVQSQTSKSTPAKRKKPILEYSLNPERPDMQNMANHLRSFINKFTSERDHIIWKKKVESNGLYQLNMIEYSLDFKAWVIVEWSHRNTVAIIQLKGTKYSRYPKFVVPVGFSVNNPQVREWYAIEDQGSAMGIRKLASVKTVERIRVFLPGKNKGRIKLYN